MRQAPIPLIPGVVDGLVRATRAPDGAVSLHVLISSGSPGEYDHVEFVLTAEHAHTLALGLMGDRFQQSGGDVALPCSVGLRRGCQG